MNVNLRGENINIPKYVVDKIPYFESLYSCESECDISLNSLSPRFMQILIEYFINDKKLDEFKYIVGEEFDEQYINTQLIYLGLKELYDDLNGRYRSAYKIINDKIAIYDVIRTADQEYNITYCGVTYDGSLISLFSNEKNEEEENINKFIFNIKNENINVIRNSSGKYILPNGSKTCLDYDKYFEEFKGLYFTNISIFAEYFRKDLLKYINDEGTDLQNNDNVLRNKPNSIELSFNMDKNNEIIGKKKIVINIRGEIIEISSYVINKIPYIKTKIDQMDGIDKMDGISEINLEDISNVSPKFFKLLINFLKNEQKPIFMKKIFDKYFDKDVIKSYLHFLQMDSLNFMLHDKCPSEKINNMTVINSLDTPLNMSNNPLKCELHNVDILIYETYRNTGLKINIENTVIRVYGRQIFKDNMKYLYFKKNETDTVSFFYLKASFK